MYLESKWFTTKVLSFVNSKDLNDWTNKSLFTSSRSQTLLCGQFRYHFMVNTFQCSIIICFDCFNWFHSTLARWSNAKDFFYNFDIIEIEINCLGSENKSKHFVYSNRCVVILAVIQYLLFGNAPIERKVNKIHCRAKTKPKWKRNETL